MSISNRWTLWATLSFGRSRKGVYYDLITVYQIRIGVFFFELDYMVNYKLQISV